MEISDIVEDSLKYPLSDLKKFLIIGIPYLIIGILALILVYESIGITTLSDVSQEALLSSPLFSTFILTTLLFMIVTFICTIIMSGIGMSIIKETIKPSDLLPNINLKVNIIDGIKSWIVSIVYIIIPTIIFLILFGIVMATLGEDSGILLLLLMLLFIIAIIIIGLLLTVAVCRLAETDSISEALNFSNIIEIGKKIGFVKIFLTLLICNVILGVISLLASLLNIIPIIGTLIVTYLLYTYIVIVTYRAYGLLYREKNEANVSQNAFQPPYTPIDDKQTQEINENKTADNVPANENLENNDFQENETEDNENTIKKCSKCGHLNPNYGTFCINCGNEI